MFVETREVMGTTVELTEADVELTDPLVDQALPGGTGHLLADRERARLRVPKVGTFAVERGSRIRFESAVGGATGAPALWLTGTVAALLLAQRGRFALHASVVEVGGVGLAVSGPRYAGKSTTALRLAQRGHPIVTDDVTPLDIGDPVVVRPLNRSVRVAEQTANGLGLDLERAFRILPHHPKLALPAPSRPPVPLAAVAVLDTDADRTVRVRAVPGARAHWLVGLNTYRGDILCPLYETEMFAWAAAVSGRVPVHAISRPAAGWTVDAVADALEDLAATEATDARPSRSAKFLDPL
jgi:hypothetical protein